MSYGWNAATEFRSGVLNGVHQREVALRSGQPVIHFFGARIEEIVGDDDAVLEQLRDDFPAPADFDSFTRSVDGLAVLDTYAAGGADYLLPFDDEIAALIAERDLYPSERLRRAIHRVVMGDDPHAELEAISGRRPPPNAPKPASATAMPTPVVLATHVPLNPPKRPVTFAEPAIAGLVEALGLDDPKAAAWTWTVSFEDTSSIKVRLADLGLVPVDVAAFALDDLVEVVAHHASAFGTIASIGACPGPPRLHRTLEAIIHSARHDGSDDLPAEFGDSVAINHTSRQSSTDLHSLARNAISTLKVEGSNHRLAWRWGIVTSSSAEAVQELERRDRAALASHESPADQASARFAQGAAVHNFRFVEQLPGDLTKVGTTAASTWLDTVSNLGGHWAALDAARNHGVAFEVWAPEGGLWRSPDATGSSAIVIAPAGADLDAERLAVGVIGFVEGSGVPSAIQSIGLQAHLPLPSARSPQAILAVSTSHRGAPSSEDLVVGVQRVRALARLRTLRPADLDTDFGPLLPLSVIATAPPLPIALDQGVSDE